MALSAFPRFLAFAATVLLSSALAAPLLADPVAVLAAVKGKVQVVPARTKGVVRATFGRGLERGDKVTVAAGGSATVFFSDGNVVELSEKSSVTIGGRAEKAPATAGLPGEVYTQVSRFVTAGSRRTGLIATTEMRGPENGAALIVAPRHTTVLQDRPTLRWRGVTGATRYRARLADAEGRELWMKETAEMELAFPADVAALAPGAAYELSVDAISDAKLLRSETVGFRIASAELARSVEENLNRIHESAGGAGTAAATYLAGSYVAGLGLYQDAARHFFALCQLDPKSPDPHEALGNVYSRVGLMDLAAAEFERALALAREP